MRTVCSVIEDSSFGRADSLVAFASAAFDSFSGACPARRAARPKNRKIITAPRLKILLILILRPPRENATSTKLNQRLLVRWSPPRLCQAPGPGPRLNPRRLRDLRTDALGPR